MTTADHTFPTLGCAHLDRITGGWYKEKSGTNTWQYGDGDPAKHPEKCHPGMGLSTHTWDRFRRPDGTFDQAGYVSAYRQSTDMFGRIMGACSGR